MTKTGADYLSQLADQRVIYLDGELVDDHVHHPAFRRTVRSAAALYDLQADPDQLEVMTFVSPSTGERVNRAWQIPKTLGELVERRHAIEAWATATYGMLGRSPDHVASCLMGMVAGVEVFEQHGPARATALLDYFTYARDHDLYLAYVLANPQADRSKSTAGQPAADLVAHVVDEDRTGITVRGAKMLGTSTVLANELLVASIQPLRPGEERYAFTAAVPIEVPGLSLLSRRSYEQAATSVFDYPLASRFDENDAIVHFQDVKIPWDRVLAFADVDMQRAQFHDTPAQVFMGYQGQIRLSVKLRFLLGLARRIAETNGTIGFAQVREQLGQLAAQVGVVDGLIAGMEFDGTATARCYMPSRRMLHAAHVTTQELYPRFVLAIRELAGGGLIMVPSSERDFAHPRIAELIDATQQSPVTGSLDRVKLFKLAWDALGSEFGSRHTHYEMFYSGATFVTRGNAYRSYDWDSATALVDDALAAYPDPPVAKTGPDLGARSAAKGIIP